MDLRQLAKMLLHDRTAANPSSCSDGESRIKPRPRDRASDSGASRTRTGSVNAHVDDVPVSCLTTPPPRALARRGSWQPFAALNADPRVMEHFPGHARPCRQRRAGRRRFSDDLARQWLRPVGGRGAGRGAVRRLRRVCASRPSRRTSRPASRSAGGWPSRTGARATRPRQPGRRRARLRPARSGRDRLVHRRRPTGARARSWSGSA